MKHYLDKRSSPHLELAHKISRKAWWITLSSRPNPLSADCLRTTKERHHVLTAQAKTCIKVEVPHTLERERERPSSMILYVKSAQNL